MKSRTPATLETRTLLELVTMVKTAAALKSGVLDLKCPCGTAMLSPTPVIPSHKDSQRGLMKSRIKRHLQERHGLSEQTVRVILTEAFPID
jgi:hypothetical protein